jgi:ribosylpyrimidine nucleosidase
VHVADDIHGTTGLDGPVFAPLTRKAEEKHAVIYLTQTLLQSDGDIAVVTTGPMTNLALAIRLEPRIVPKIKEIVFMGGSYQMGNVTPAAEFNILADADAAHVVVGCGRPITMVGLDVTRKALCLPGIVARMARVGNRAAGLFADAMRFFNETQNKVFGWEGGPLHDPVTIAYLIDRGVLRVKPMFTQIDIRSEQSYGRTNCDYFGYLRQEPNVSVAIDINVPRFWDIVEEAIRRYA